MFFFLSILNDALDWKILIDTFEQNYRILKKLSVSSLRPDILVKARLYAVGVGARGNPATFLYYLGFNLFLAMKRHARRPFIASLQIQLISETNFGMVPRPPP